MSPADQCSKHNTDHLRLLQPAFMVIAFMVENIKMNMHQSNFYSEFYCGVKITNIATMLLLQVTWTDDMAEVMRKRPPKDYSC